MFANVLCARALGVALPLLFLAGCGGSATIPSSVTAVPPPGGYPALPSSQIVTQTLPPAALEKGWTQYAKPAEGFTLALPPAWKPIEQDPKTLKAMSQAAAQNNPQLVPALRAAEQQYASGMLKLMAFDASPTAAASGLISNLQVTKQTLPAAVSLDFYVQVNVAQLESLPNIVKPVLHRPVTLSSGEKGERLQSGITMNLPNQHALSMTTIIYMALKDRDAYIVTLTTPSSQAEKTTPILDKIGQSFRLVNK